jgi:hypothetical protein
MATLVQKDPYRKIKKHLDDIKQEQAIQSKKIAEIKQTPKIKINELLEKTTQAHDDISSTAYYLKEIYENTKREWPEIKDLKKKVDDLTKQNLELIQYLQDLTSSIKNLLAAETQRIPSAPVPKLPQHYKKLPLRYKRTKEVRHV